MHNRGDTETKLELDFRQHHQNKKAPSRVAAALSIERTWDMVEIYYEGLQIQEGEKSIGTAVFPAPQEINELLVFNKKKEQ